MPARILNARITQGLIDLFDLKGRHQLQVDEVVVPVVVVGDTTPHDLRGLAPSAAQGGTLQGGAAGFVSQVQVFNPPGSEVLCHVTRVLAMNPVADRLHMGPLTAALAANLTGQWQNRREVVGSVPAARIERQTVNAASVLINPVVMNTVADVLYQIPVDVWLEPGDGWSLSTVAQNTALFGNFFWTEEPLP